MKQLGSLIKIKRRAHRQSFGSEKCSATFALLPRSFQVVKWRPLAILLVGLAMLGATQAPAWSAGVTDLIWLESNSTAGNSILTFKNDGSGSPTFLGSTSAGGIGVFDATFALGPFDSDQNLIVNPDGTLLFAVNSGSNSIAVFRITSNGLQARRGLAFSLRWKRPCKLGAEPQHPDGC